MVAVVVSVWDAFPPMLVGRFVHSAFKFVSSAAVINVRSRAVGVLTFICESSPGKWLPVSFLLLQEIESEPVCE